MRIAPKYLIGAAALTALGAGVAQAAEDPRMRRVLMDNYQDTSEHDCGENCARC